MKAVYNIFGEYKEQTLEMQKKMREVEGDYDFYICYSKRGKEIYGGCAVSDPLEKNDKPRDRLAIDMVNILDKLRDDTRKK